MLAAVWLLAVVAGWIALAYAAATTPGGSSEIWILMRDQTVLVQVVLWLLLLLYTFATWVWSTSWGY